MISPYVIMENLTETSNNVTEPTVTNLGYRYDEVVLLQIEKRLKCFFGELTDMTRCLISRKQMVEPWIGEDK